MDIKSHVEALNASRIKAIKALNDHFDSVVAAHPGAPMNEEEKAVEARITAEIDAIEAEVKRFVAQESREQESAKIRETHASLFGVPDAKKEDRPSEADRLKAWARGAGAPGLDINLAAGKQFVEAVRAGGNPKDVRAAIYTHVDSGSLLVPTDLSSQIYGYLTDSVAMMAMPTTKIVTASGNPLDFPKVGTHGIGTQVGEGTAIGGTDAIFAKMTLNAYKYGQLVQLSAETIADDGVDILGFVASNIGRAVGEQIGTALVSGDGSGEPNGINAALTNANVSGGTVHGLVAGVTYENLVDLQYRVNGNYRGRSSAAWLTRDLTAGSLRKLRDGAGGTLGAVLWSPSLTQGIQGAEPDLLLGTPVFTDPNVASVASTHKPVFFGDWSAYYIRIADTFRLERSDDYAFNTDLVTFRGLARVDGDVIDTTALNAIRVV
jgi:HK97 family phage major capsid protein